MEPVHEEEYKGKVIRIFQDDVDYSDGPRSWDNMGTIVTICRSNSDFDGIGDERINDVDEANDLIKRLNKEKAIYVPIYGYSHSGITIHAGPDRPYPFNDEWDSGFVGLAYVEPAKMRTDFMVKHITKKVREKAKKNLLIEIETLNDALTGNVYGYEVVEPETDAAPEEILDSCWGFYGDYDDKDYSALAEAKEVVDSMEAKNATG